MSTWTFNRDVAEQFDAIAQSNIPNYEMVIQRCLTIAEAAFQDKKKARIIDVGSATGRTLTRFVAAGFTNVCGVEKSPDMAEASAHKDKVIVSGVFPAAEGPYDMVIANWTLHFVHERETYLRSIHEGLKPNGLLVLSDKMAASAFTHNRYLDFKRSKGLTEKQIRDKEAAIQGVLVPKPLAWYLEILSDIGFADIEIIDAAWCFNTILCRKV